MLAQRDSYQNATQIGACKAFTAPFYRHDAVGGE
jgi:hypothetical protein